LNQVHQVKADGHVTRAFWRNEDGSWICIDPVTLDHPSGRIQLSPGTTLLPGEIFMGVDVAAWLDEQDQLRKAASN
jgi:hypothetical protein